MKYLWCFAIIGISLAVMTSVYAKDEGVAALEKSSDPISLVEADSAAVGDGASNREARQFGFYRPRPFYGGYRPFYRPPPFYGGYYRPYYGGFYRPRPPPFFGIGFYG